MAWVSESGVTVISMRASISKDSSTGMGFYSVQFKAGNTKENGLMEKCKVSELVSGKMALSIRETGLKVSSKDRGS